MASHIDNCPSLVTSLFPERFKFPKVIPLYKEDDKLIIGNYSPILYWFGYQNYLKK